MDIPAKHGGLIDPAALPKSDMARARGAWIEAADGCTRRAAGDGWLCITDLSSYRALGYTEIILILSLAEILLFSSIVDTVTRRKESMVQEHIYPFLPRRRSWE